MEDEGKIAFRGTRHGVLVSISEEGDLLDNLEEFAGKIEANRAFFRGAPVSIDLGWRDISEDELGAIQDFIRDHELTLQGLISSSGFTKRLAEENGIKVIIGRLGLAEHYARTIKAAPRQVPPSPIVAPEEETVLLRRTIRSGQKIECRGNMVILGDVNPGGEVRARGDVLVLGALRGVAHAGCEGKESSVVLALIFQPTQLRIGNHIAILRQSKKYPENVPVIARVQNGAVVTAPYRGSS